MERAFDHSDFREHLDAYLAGGLTAAVRAAFDAHAAACDACAELLADAARRDQSLRQLFADARPPADLEERVVEGLRAAPLRLPARLRLPVPHPAVRRAATAAAAVLLLGGFGYVGSSAIRDGGLPLPAPWANQRPAAVALNSWGEAPATRQLWQSPKDMAERLTRLSRERVGGEPQRGRRPLGERSEAHDYARMDSGMGGHRAIVLTPPASEPAPAPAKPEPAAVEAGQGVDRRSGAAKLSEDEARAKHWTRAQPELAYGFGATGRDGGQSGGGDGRSPNGAATETEGAVFRDNVYKLPAPANLPELSKRQADASAGKSLFIQPPGDAFKPDAYFHAAGAAAAAPEAQIVKDLSGVRLSGLQAAEPADVTPQSGGAPVAQPVAQPAPAQPPATPVEQATPAVQPAPAAGRKIIRNGEMSFEVDSFDTAYLQITKIAAEEGGFVATTDSEKLANSKVRGTVTVRVPPERLDTLVLKLRGLGDLKSSRLAAQDITKQYTDLESQLRASRAMEERLLNIIKTGKGTIKELVEAEKQLGVYREKIERVEGEIRYYNNLVSLSTLNVTLTERDIRTAAMLSETEQVNMGVEAQDVEAARAATIKAVEEAKGRIVESDLKKLEAGQFAGRVVADVPPDAAGPLIDRMKQIGTVARLEVSRKQSTPEGTVAPAPAQGGAGVRVERRDTRFLVSLYNLANVAPRQTTSLNLAAEDVEAAYRTILEQVRGAGGRVVTSQLNRPRPDQTTGTITFEAPAEGADVLLGAVRAAGEVMRLDVTQNPDAQNVTEAKRGFAVQVFSTASVAPRETTSLRVAARGVADSFNRLREAVRSAQGARVLSSQLAEQDPANVTGTLDFEVRRQDWAAVEAALRDAGQVVSRNVTRSADAENTLDSKVRLQVVLVDEAALQPRETVTLHLAVSDVPGQYAKLLEAAAAAQARVLQSQLAEQGSREDVTGTLVFDVRRDSRAAVDRAVGEAGDAVSRSVVRSTDTQNTLDDKVRLSLTLTDADRLAPRETTTLGMEAGDVEKAKEQVESLALSLGGRVVDSTLSRETSGRVTAQVVADVPLARALEMVRRTREQGRVQFRRDARDENVPAGSLARARVDVTLANEELIVESGQGLAARIREGLRTSVTGLLWSVQLIVIGLFLVAPWALIVYFAWRLVHRGRARRTPTVAPA